MDAGLIRTLKIKVGSLNRNKKDIEFAVKDLTKEQERLAQYEQENDANKVNQQKKVVDEATKMIPIGIQRLKTTYDDVLTFKNELPLPAVPPPKEVEDAANAAAAAAAAAAATSAESQTTPDAKAPTADAKTVSSIDSPCAQSTTSSAPPGDSSVSKLPQTYDAETEARKILDETLEAAKAMLLTHGCNVEDDE